MQHGGRFLEEYVSVVHPDRIEPLMRGIPPRPRPIRVQW